MQQALTRLNAAADELEVLLNKRRPPPQLSGNDSPRDSALKSTVAEWQAAASQARGEAARLRISAASNAWFCALLASSCSRRD